MVVCVVYAYNLTVALITCLLRRQMEESNILRCSPYKMSKHSSCVHHLIMASGIDWSSLLEKKYSSYKVEVNAFLDSLDIANSIEISIQHIYEAIKGDSKVHENLKALYCEAINGTNREVKNRIRNRVSNFKRALK